MKYFVLNIGIVVVVLMMMIAINGIECNHILSHHHQQSHDEVIAFWTEERLRSAIPLDRRPLTLEQINQIEESHISTKLTDKILIDQPSGPSYRQSNKQRSINKVNASPQKGTIRVPINQYTNEPYKSVGRVFMSDSKYTYTCSASVSGGNVVLTAGHCTSPGGGKPLYKNWIFMPQYNNKTTPLGTWSANQTFYFSGWYYNGLFGNDVAFVVMNPLNGVYLENVTDSLGILCNGPRGVWFYACGYPGNAQFTGEEMICTYAPGSAVDNSKKPPTTGIITPMGSGASGGPWMIDSVICSGNDCPTSTNYNYANGLDSYYLPGSNSAYLWSPYFNTDVWNMRQKALRVQV